MSITCMHENPFLTGKKTVTHDAIQSTEREKHTTVTAGINFDHDTSV